MLWYLIMLPAMLQPIILNDNYHQSQAVIKQLSDVSSQESLNTLVKESIQRNLVGNSAVEAFAKHLPFSSTSTQRSWEVMEVDPDDKLSLLPHIALDCIFMQLPPKDRMRLGLVNRTLFTHVQRDRLWRKEGSLEAVQYLWSLIQTIEENLCELKLAETQGLGEENRSKYPRFEPTSTLLLRFERLKTMLYLACPESLLPLFGKVDKAFQTARTLRSHPEDFVPLLQRVAEHSLDYGAGYEIRGVNEKVVFILSCYGIPRKAVPVFCASVTKLFISNRLNDFTALRIIYSIRQDLPDLDLTTMIPTDFFIQNHMIAQPAIID